MGNYFDTANNRFVFEELAENYRAWKTDQSDPEAAACAESVCRRMGISLAEYDPGRNYVLAVQEIMGRIYRLHEQKALQGLAVE